MSPIQKIMSKSRGVWIILAFVARGMAWSCDFETGNICDLEQSILDDFDWTLQQGQTPSNVTGPSTDHTRNDSSGYYLFIETSEPQFTNQNAVLLSPELPAGYYSVSLWYNVYGSDVWVFRVNFVQRSIESCCEWNCEQFCPQFHELIFYYSSKFNNQSQSNDQWIQANMNISASNPFTVIFEGIRGEGPFGDIGLDDINVQRIAEPLPEKTASPYGLPINCTFETDEDCGLESPYYNSQTDWVRIRGPTPSEDTGPDIDHTLGTAEGYYIFAEASNKGEDWTCIIATRSFWPTDGWFTLSFYYHAYGFNFNMLQVFEEGVSKPIWEISPTSSVHWHLVTLNHTLIKPGRLLFAGLTGRNHQADYGLDDIIIEPNKYGLVKTTQTTQTQRTPTQTTPNSANNQIAMLQLYAVLSLL